MLIVARGNPRWLLVSSGRGGGEGGGEGDTTLLNNCGATQVENSKVSLEGTAILLRQHGKKFILR